jgi:hypothetical protein
MYPVYVYEEGMSLPKEGTYYVVSGNGLWLHKDTGIVRSFVPVKNISCLEDLVAEVELECKLPKIPERLVWRVKEFFRRVVEIHRAESEVTLYYNKDKKEFKVHIPKQQVSHSGVEYKRVGLTHLEGMEDYLRVGTIHSHCDFGAFHSGTDEGDEKDFDGLHVTFGHNDRDDFTIAASIVVNGYRTKIDPETVLEGIVLQSTISIRDDLTYRLNSTHDREKHEWAEGIDNWLKRVEGRSRSYGWWPHSSRSSTSIEKGSKVAWIDNEETASLKVVLGEGPFEVTDAEDGKVTIQTQTGLARLSEKLFCKDKS